MPDQVRHDEGAQVMKQLNVWPMLMLLIIVLGLIYWFGSIR